MPVLVHADPRAALGPAAARIYGDPSTRLDVLGVTGTSGKTTTVYLLEAALAAAGASTGLIGTVETRLGGRRLPSAFTTPEAPDLQALLATMVDERRDARRHGGLQPRAARSAASPAPGSRSGRSPTSRRSTSTSTPTWRTTSRRRRACSTGAPRAEVVCVDSAWGQRLVREGDGHRRHARRRLARHRRRRPAGRHAALHRARPGRARAAGRPCGCPAPFNVTNALLALACGHAAGQDPAALARGLAQVRVPGRMQRVEAGQPFLAVVDYAHKPAAVGALLETLRAQAAERPRAHRAGLRRRPRPRQAPGDGPAGRPALRPPAGSPTTTRAPRTRPRSAPRCSTGAREVPRRRWSTRSATAAPPSPRPWPRRAPATSSSIAGKGHETGQQVGGRDAPVLRRRGARARDLRRPGRSRVIELTLADVARVTGGRLHRASGDERVTGSVEFDSRAVGPGRAVRRPARRAGRRPRLRGRRDGGGRGRCAGRP